MSVRQWNDPDNDIYWQFLTLNKMERENAQNWLSFFWHPVSSVWLMMMMAMAETQNDVAF